MIGAMLHHYRPPLPDQANEDISSARPTTPEAFVVAVLIAAAEDPALLEPVRVLLQLHSLNAAEPSPLNLNLLLLIGGLVERFNFGRLKKMSKTTAVHSSKGK